MIEDPAHTDQTPGPKTGHWPVGVLALLKTSLAFLALGLSFGAHAQTIDQSELGALMQELVPDVE